MPNKNVEGQLKHIHDQEKPGGSSNEVVLGQAHREKINIGKRPGQITHHRGYPRQRSNGAGKRPMRRDGLYLFPVPPIHHNYRNDNDNGHSDSKEAFRKVLTNKNPNQYPKYYPRQYLKNIAPLRMPVVVDYGKNIRQNK